MIWPILEARAEIQKYFRWFLVQMKTSKFAFEINWPLGTAASKYPLNIGTLYVTDWAFNVSHFSFRKKFALKNMGKVGN
jgi:hypothetical protein